MAKQIRQRKSPERSNSTSGQNERLIELGFKILDLGAKYIEKYLKKKPRESYPSISVDQIPLDSDKMKELAAKFDIPVDKAADLLATLLPIAFDKSAPEGNVAAPVTQPQANSSRSPNRPISVDQILLDSDKMKELAAKFDIPVDKAADLLATLLPIAFDKAAPEGTLPAVTPRL
jgi:uncharacterized protein YidB (DUF937 family)